MVLFSLFSFYFLFPHRCAHTQHSRIDIYTLKYIETESQFSTCILNASKNWVRRFTSLLNLDFCFVMFFVGIINAQLLLLILEFYPV